MPSLEGVKVGDTLLLFTRMGGAREKEQVPQEVTVVKVGRTLLHIPGVESQPDGKTFAYRIEDGYRNDNYRHTQLMTREAWEDENRRASLWDRLREHGLTGNMRGKPLTTEALADVVAVLDEHAAKEH
jgi:hypothetical protein